MSGQTPPGLRFLDEAILRLQRQGLWRERSAPRPHGAISFCSNDYLALAAEVTSTTASGAGASRLVSGERLEHLELEQCAASLVGLPSALAFTSGYAANVGALTALAGPSDLIVSDALNHASIVDGARLSRARIHVVPHLDVQAIGRALSSPREGRALVVTESYFSMDADAPDLVELRRVCNLAGALLFVDEAHALGVLGPDGRGMCAEAGIQADVLVGTFGKAFGAGGAFVAGCPMLVDWLWNRARTFVFSTGLSPAVSAAAARGLRISLDEPIRRQRVRVSSTRFRAGLEGLGIRPLGFGHIVPWVLGEASEAMRWARLLRAANVDVCAVRPPSVSPGTARVRFTVTAAHSHDHIDDALSALERLLYQERPGVQPPATLP